MPRTPEKGRHLFSKTFISLPKHSLLRGGIAHVNQCKRNQHWLRCYLLARVNPWLLDGLRISINKNTPKEQYRLVTSTAALLMRDMVYIALYRGQTCVN